MRAPHRKRTLPLRVQRRQMSLSCTKRKLPGACSRGTYLLFSEPWITHTHAFTQRTCTHLAHSCRITRAMPLISVNNVWINELMNYYHSILARAIIDALTPWFFLPRSDSLFLHFYSKKQKTKNKKKQKNKTQKHTTSNKKTLFVYFLHSPSSVPSPLPTQRIVSESANVRKNHRPLLLLPPQPLSQPQMAPAHPCPLPHLLRVLRPPPQRRKNKRKRSRRRPLPRRRAPARKHNRRLAPTANSRWRAF